MAKFHLMKITSISVAEFNGKTSISVAELNGKTSISVAEFASNRLSMGTNNK